jgi:hypothetical protein
MESKRLESGGRGMRNLVRMQIRDWSSFESPKYRVVKGRQHIKINTQTTAVYRSLLLIRISGVWSLNLTREAGYLETFS